MKKYRLGNQTKEYELSDDYLGWLPEGQADWQSMFLDFVKNTELTIINPNDQAKEKIFLHHFIIRDAFPMSFFGEKRSRNWWVFAIVSRDQASEEFIIPLY